MLMFKIYNRLSRTFFELFSKIIFLGKMKYWGNKIGNGSSLDGKIIVKAGGKGNLNIGKNFKLNSRVTSNLVGITNPAIFQLIGDGTISIGDDCGFTSTVLSSRSKIVIGDRVMIGGNVRIFDHDYHSLNYQHRKNSQTDSTNCLSIPVSIGNDVFIGTNSIILKGVNIGDRSIIGAGSVVSLREIPPDSLVVGNPARIIKRLTFDD